MKLRLVEAKLFHADGRTDGRTDTTKVTVAFRIFANAPKHRTPAVNTLTVGCLKHCLRILPTVT